MGGGQCRCCGSFLDPQLEHAAAALPKPREDTTHDAWITTEPRGLPLRNPGRLIFSPPLLSPGTQCGPWVCVCVWPPPLQRQLAETPHRRHSIVTFTSQKRNRGTATTRHSLSPSCLDSGWATAASLNWNASARSRTLPPVGTANRCRRNHFKADGNMKSKSAESSHGKSSFAKSIGTGRTAPHCIIDGALHQW